MFYVYEFRDDAGIPFYVGKGSKSRFAQHEGRARRGVRSYFYNKLRKLWREGRRHTRAIVFETLFEDLALAEEKRLIALYGRHTLTNQTDGGIGVPKLSAQAKERIAASRRGKVAGELTRERLRLSHLGKQHTAHTKRKIAAKQSTIKKPWAVNSRPNLGNGFLGRKWSASHRAKFVKARIGHAVSPETRLKISQSKRQ